MMKNADVSIDEAKANAWAREVQLKLSEVDKTLDKVSNLRNSMPGTNDTIFMMMEKVSVKMSEVWGSTQKSFRRGWDILEEGLKTFGKSGQVLQGAFEELEKRL